MMIDQAPKILFVVGLSVTALGCGKLSDVVAIDYKNPAAQVIPSSPSLGLSSGASTLTSGSFQLEAAIGEPASGAKSSGGFTLYGGIQGQAISR